MNAHMMNQSPMQILLQQMQAQAMSNPQMAQALQMVQGKSPAQLQELARNLYQSSGRDYNQFTQQAQNNPQLQAMINMMRGQKFF